MESLNISQLNLSSVRSYTSKENPQMVELPESRFETSSLTDDEDYLCEYQEDIWQTLVEQEAEKPTIHLQSPELAFRGALVQQMREVSKKLGLSLATLHSAVAHLDLFMDAHRLRTDRLKHVAMACLSLAAKSEEELNRAPSLKTLSKVSGVQLCGKTFRQLEWMVGQHVRWRLLAPTPVSFAAVLAQYVVTDADLTTRHPKFVRRFKRDGAKLLEAYLDLTLSDVRLKAGGSAEVGCACVACARAALGLTAWPAWLARTARLPHRSVAPLARLLQRMMNIVKSRETKEMDQGYGSARTSPNITPSTSPSNLSPASNTSSSTSIQNDSYRERPITERRPDNNHSVLNLSDSDIPTVPEYFLPTAVDMTMQRVNSVDDYRYYKNSRLIDLESGPSTSMAVKRGLDVNLDVENKRYRLTTQMTQVVQ